MSRLLLLLILALAGCNEGNKPQPLKRDVSLHQPEQNLNKGVVMKSMMPLLVLALSLPAFADDKEAESKAKSLLEKASKVVEVMKGIKDKESAEKAKADLEKAFSAMTRSKDELRKVSEEERGKLKETFGAKFEALQAEFKKEGVRLQKLPAVMKVLVDSGPFREAREAKIQVARAMVVNLDKALQTYKLTTGGYPKTLTLLTSSPGGGVPPFLKKQALKDPWDRPFQYDPDGPKNKGSKPDVWSLGPPDEKSALIGNWEPK